MRGAGVGGKLGTSCGGGVLREEQEALALGDRCQKHPLLPDSQSEIQRIWFYQVRTAQSIILAAVKRYFPQLIPSTAEDLPPVRDHFWKTIWIQPLFSGEWESLTVWTRAVPCQLAAAQGSYPWHV